MPPKKHIYGHWTTTLNLNPDTSFGFIYRITNLTNGRMYIGKKQYKFKPNTKQAKTSNWKSYCGSNQYLKEDIKELGKDKFKFEILEEYRTKGWWTYAEANMQHKCNVLTEWLDDDTRLYYNNQIGAIKYVLKKHDDPTPVRRKKKSDEEG